MTPALTAMTILAITTLSYVVLCAASPFGPCRRCEGLGFQLETTRRGKPKRGPDCRRCHGAGRRLRTGRRLHNAWTRLHHDSTH
jgi:hypothetical protein